ncbi:MAG TPA: ATP-binding protein [Cyclobacteriaceae bacterium]|nr:ATP-binding protein [Cyclobacteriaceae bacterium]
MSLRFLLGLILVMVFCELQGQQYRFKQYRVSEGLPSDVVKSVSQDTLGFFWIATDDGLVKFDGTNFTVYKSALRSQYVKGFLKTPQGRLFVIGDLDLVEIQNQIDTVLFKSVIKGGRIPTDSTISYPKSIYLDRAGLIWISEPSSVVHYDGKKLKRFDFGDENLSPIFIRSFSFFEDHHGELYTVAYNGNVFHYDRYKDIFIQLNKKLPEEVNHVLYDGDHLLVACNSGLFSARLEDNQIVTITKTHPDIRDISYLTIEDDSSLCVSTYTNTIWKVNRKTFSAESLSYTFDGINSCYVSDEGDIWASTDKGVVLVQRNLFELVDPYSRTHFIEGIAENPHTKTIYFCNKDNLIALRPDKKSGWKREVIHQFRRGYFQDLRFGKQGLWAANSFLVMLFKDDKLFKQWNFSRHGNFVYDIFLDSHDNVWLSQSSSSEVSVISDDLSIKHYHVPIHSQGEVNLVREGPMGIYAAASGVDGYLFLKRNNSEEFKNISLPVDFNIEGDFNIQSMAIQNNVVWLASTEGLLRYDHKSIRRIDLGESLTQFSVSSVSVLNDRNILFANSYGLFRYDVITGEYWLYDENAGLPSNTITEHGIFVDHQGYPWVGTSNGICHFPQSLLQSSVTLKPYCVDANVNGISHQFMKGLRVEYGAFIHLKFSAITFPENKINMQWKMPKTNDNWHILINHELSLSDLKSGDYRILVRAKKNTGLGWSEPTEVQIHVGKPLWLRTEFVLYTMLLTVLIAWSSYAISAAILNKRKAHLEQLVQQRTQDLQRTNEELSLRNNELDRFVYSASHDLSAPLKSLLGLISVARLENPGDVHVQYLLMMENSVRKLDGFIQEVVSYSRNVRMNVRFEQFNFKELVEGLLQDYQYAENFKSIEFKVEDNSGQLMISDLTRLKIILNNLISNAIKFKRTVPNGISFVKISLQIADNNYILTVEDNGRGIEQEHVNHIFDMFYRASDKGQGSGLGLYILKEAVTKLMGNVIVKSQLDKGSTFVITLPIPSLTSDLNN